MIVVDDDSFLIESSWEDERTGVWTKLVFGKDWVTIRLTNSHLGGAIVGFVVVVFAVWFKQNGLLVSMLFCMALWAASKYRSTRKRFPVTIVRRPTTGPGGGREILATEISAIVVRENTNRDAVDDHRMVQLYLLTGQGPLLIHQRYYSAANRRRVLAIGAELEGWLTESVEQA